MQSHVNKLCMLINYVMAEISEQNSRGVSDVIVEGK